jgi:hypothetical protein
MADELKEVVLKYVTAEYLEDDADPITFDTPLISGGIVDSFSMVSLKQVQDFDPGRPGHARGLRLGR